MGLLDDYKQLLTNERQKEKIRGLLGIADTVTGADQIRGIPADPRNWTIDDTAKMLNFAGGGIGAIKTYHGSPHKFDAFDMSKIGTGEGAQAYGHGLYFAENPEVAKNYQDWLGKSELLLNGKRLVSPDWNAYGSSNPWILDEMENIIPEKFTEKAKLSTGKESKKLLQNLAENFDLMKGKGVFDEEGIWSKNPLEQEFFDWVKSQNPEYHKGSIYKTSLEWPDAAREAADPLGPQHFLDWDKPLSEQPSIADRVNLLPENIKQRLIDSMNIGFNTSDVKEVGKSLNGNVLVNKLGGDYDIGSMSEASSELNKLGIPGIRYLDGGSRGAGEGSYNYVVFDDQIPRIVERNGKPLKGLLGK